MSRVHRTRLRTRDAWVDVRWAAFGDRWIASADTPDGPTLGVGWTPHEALCTALEPFDEGWRRESVGGDDTPAI